jgi:hypothetical protein
VCEEEGQVGPGDEVAEDLGSTRGDPPVLDEKIAACHIRFAPTRQPPVW